MDWQGFCRQIISKSKRTGNEVRASATAEWKELFPTGRLDLGFTRKTDEKIDHEVWEKIVATASQHDIARAISEQNCVLLVDEFERAKPELAGSVSEVCKILGQTYRSDDPDFEHVMIDATIARYLGTTAELWLRLQARYDLETARQKPDKDIAAIKPRRTA